MLWSNYINSAPAGPFTLTSTGSQLTETDAEGQVVWSVPQQGAPPPPLPPLSSTYTALSSTSDGVYSTSLTTQGTTGAGLCRHTAAAAQVHTASAGMT